MSFKITFDVFRSFCGYRISSNYSQGAIIPFFRKKGTFIRGKVINIRGRRLIQILLTGSRALNILFYYPIKGSEGAIIRGRW